jgi:serine/threonine protein kinase
MRRPSDDNLYLLTEFMANGSLHRFTKRRRDLVWDATTVSKAIFGIPAGMAYRHNRGINHRDLKSDTILINDDLEVVICDFGNSRFGLSDNPGRFCCLGSDVAFGCLFFDITCSLRCL